jgi:UDP-N-acetylglucosamine 3-dehydrogenase
LKERTKLLLIGLGAMGRNHLRVLKSLDAIVEIVGIVDPLVSFPFVEIPIFRSLSLVDVYYDCAIVACPTSLHAYYCRELASRGKHFMVEKPVSIDTDSLSGVLELIDEHRIIACVGHVERFNNAVIKAKEVLDNGIIGKPLVMRTLRQGPIPKRIQDVGVTLDLLTHDIHLALWLLGNDYETIEAIGTFLPEIDNEVSVEIIARNSEDIAIIHSASWISPKKDRQVFLIGESGALEIDTLRSELIHYRSSEFPVSDPVLERLNGAVEIEINRPSFPKEEPLKNELLGFLESCATGKVISGKLVSIKEGIRVLEIAEEIMRKISREQ